MTADTREFVDYRFPRFLSDLVVAARLLKRDGAGPTFSHAKIVALRRLHGLLMDRRLMTGLPHPLLGQFLLTGLTLRTLMTEEASAAGPCSPVPALTLDWAIGGLDIDPRAWHFVDIGSGTGWALQVALRHSFRAFTGVEFAGETHAKARENLAWLAAHGHTRGRPVDLRHESALQTELPEGPCVLLMFCSFDQRVMRPFISKIERSVAAAPRPIIALYVNPTQRGLFARPGIRELALSRRYRLLIDLFSPYAVRAYRFGPADDRH
jgi:SAM-dependent methyltransferase